MIPCDDRFVLPFDAHRDSFRTLTTVAIPSTAAITTLFNKEKTKALAEAIRTFYSWAISPSGGATPDNLAAVDFVALPQVVIPKVNAAIQKITG